MSGSVPGAIQPIAPYQAPDIVGMAGQYAGLQNQLLQNKQTQQQLNAKIAVGQAWSNAIDPNTGKLDENKLLTSVAGNPNAAYLAGDVIAQAQARQQEQYTLNQDQLAQTTNRLGIYKSAFAPLLAKGNNIQTGDIYAAIKGLAAAGAPTDEIAADVGATMPTEDPTQMNDPGYQAKYGQQLHDWAQNQWGSNLSGEAQAQIFRPNLTPINTGGGITLQDTNPTTSPGAAGSTLTNTLTPAQAVAPVSGMTPAGVPFEMPTSQFAQRTGNGNLVAGGASGGAPAGNSIFGTGRLPGRGAPYSGPQAGAGGSAVGGSAVPPGTLQTGLPPGQAAGADVAGAGSANDLHSLYSSVSTSGARLYQLNTALNSLQALGTTGSGPGTDVRNSIQSYLQSIPGVGGALSGVIGGDPTKIANYDEANKYLTAYASNQASNLGAGTDSKLATALSSNASTHISNLAGVNVVKATIGLEKMQQAQAQGFQQSGLPASQYDQWATNWNKTADARVYAFDLLTPQQRGTVLSGMTGGARSQFLGQVRSAIQGGFLDRAKLGIASGSAAAAAPAASGPPIDPNTGLPVGITP